MQSNPIPLAQCPFCQAPISVSPAGLVARHRAVQPGWDQIVIPEEPDHGVFVFGSGGGGHTPCEHLLQLDGRISYNEIASRRAPSPSWHCDFEAWHPALADMDRGQAAQRAVQDRIFNRGLPNAPRNVPFCHACFGERWTNSQQPIPNCYHLRGVALFASDPRALLDDLVAREQSAVEEIGRYEDVDVDVEGEEVEVEDLDDFEEYESHRAEEEVEEPVADNDSVLCPACDERTEDVLPALGHPPPGPAVLGQPDHGTAIGTDERPLRRQMLQDMEDFFYRLPAFSYIFVASGRGRRGEQANALGPTLISTIELVHSACADDSYDGPYPADDFHEAASEARRRHAEIVVAVELRLAELRRRPGVSFVLCWHAYGDDKGRMDFSADYDWETARDELVSVLHEELDLMTA